MLLDEGGVEKPAVGVDGEVPAGMLEDNVNRSVGQQDGMSADEPVVSFVFLRPIVPGPDEHATIDAVAM